MKPEMQTERVWFRMFFMPCCGHQLCWVNPRLPNYCPECGTILFGKHDEFKAGKHSNINDSYAYLKYRPLPGKDV